MKWYIPAALAFVFAVITVPVTASANGPYPYPVVSIDASPLVVEDDSLVRVSWSSVWGDPYNTWSARAYRDISKEFSECTLTARSNITNRVEYRRVVANIGYVDTPVIEDTTFTISCGGEVERGRCNDHVAARPDNGPDSVCRGIERANDDVKDGRPQGPSIYGKYHLYTESLTVTTDFPKDPLVAACTVTPTTAMPGDNVTWSATAQGGKAVYYTDRWDTESERCPSAYNLPLCSDDVSYRGSCSVAGETCIMPGDRERCIDTSPRDGIEAQPVLTDPDGPPPGIAFWNTNVYACKAVGTYGTNYRYSWSGTDGLISDLAQVVKSYLSSGVKSGTVSVESAGGTATKTCQVPVGAPPTQPNLSATTGSAISGTAGQGTTLTGTTHNTGDAAAPAGFNDLFIVYQADQVTEHGSVPVSANPSIGPASSVARSVSYAFPAAGTYYYRLCTDWNGSVAESNEADNCSALQSVVISSLAADLTTGAISPTAATLGTPATFSAVATNIGSGSSGSFPILFQIENGPLFTSGYIAGLAQGASGAASASHTFSSAGTYQIRACANYNTAWTAITTESNYSNNCGPWTTVTVTPDTAPTPTCSLATSGSGVPSTLIWSSMNATSCTGGGFSTGGATSGSASASVTGNYLLSCTGAGGSCSASVTVSDGACSGTPVLEITAVPNRVQAGQTATVSWNASNVASGSCTVSGPGVLQTIPAAAAPQCTIPNGSAAQVITTQSTYTITCGATSKSVTVNVIPQYQEF